MTQEPINFENVQNFRPRTRKLAHFLENLGNRTSTAVAMSYGLCMRLSFSIQFTTGDYYLNFLEVSLGDIKLGVISSRIEIVHQACKEKLSCLRIYERFEFTFLGESLNSILIKMWVVKKVTFMRFVKYSKAVSECTSEVEYLYFEWDEEKWKLTSKNQW